MQGGENIDIPTAEAAVKPRMSAARRFWRRRRYFIDPKVQGRLMAAFFIQLLVFVSVLSVSLFLPPMTVLRQEHAEPTKLLAAAREMIALDARYWPAMMAAVALVLLFGLRTSHKLAGPLYRFRCVFDALRRREDPGRVRLREGDFLIPEAEQLDLVVRKVVADRRRLADFERETALLLDELANESGVESEHLQNMIRRRLGLLLDPEQGR